MEAIAIINMHYMYGDDSDWRGARLNLLRRQSSGTWIFQDWGIFPFQDGESTQLDELYRLAPPTHPAADPPTHPITATHGPRPTRDPPRRGAERQQQQQQITNNNNKQQQQNIASGPQDGGPPNPPPPTHAHAGPASPFRRASPPHSDFIYCLCILL